MILANISNGLAFKHDDVCYFQSQHGHNAKFGYFRIDAMPYKAVIHLLEGRDITIIDATRRHKPLTDGLKFGVSCFCLVFNRAIGIFDKSYRYIKVCEWQTPEMLKIARSDIHKPLVQTIRKLTKIYGYIRPAIIGSNVHLECHQGFIADDKPARLREMVNT